MVPALVEYCQVPCVPALAVLPTTAMPPKLEPASMSANWPVKIVVTVWPAGLAVSSTTAASVPLPRVGASLIALTVIVALTVLPPRPASPLDFEA